MKLERLNVASKIKKFLNLSIIYDFLKKCVDFRCTKILHNQQLENQNFISICIKTSCAIMCSRHYNFENFKNCHLSPNCLFLPTVRRLWVTADCAQRFDTSFFLEKKIGRNCRYFCCKLPPIAPARRTYGHFLVFDNYIYTKNADNPTYSIYTSAWPFTPTTKEFRETASQFLASPCLPFRLGKTCVSISGGQRRF